jgi:hypothetical protein
MLSHAQIDAPDSANLQGKDANGCADWQSHV